MQTSKSATDSSPTVLQWYLLHHIRRESRPVCHLCMCLSAHVYHQNRWSLRRESIVCRPRATTIVSRLSSSSRADVCCLFVPLSITLTDRCIIAFYLVQVSVMQHQM